MFSRISCPTSVSPTWMRCSVAWVRTVVERMSRSWRMASFTPSKGLWETMRSP